MFPIEILLNIFQRLPHKSLAQVSLVCKDWYLAARSPILYRTLLIHNKKQLYKFIQTATIFSTQPPGHFVQHLILDDYFELDRLTNDDIKLLFATCPNITHIAGERIMFPSNVKSLAKSSIWHQFTHLPLWFTNKNKNWYEMVQQNNRYISLEFSITPEMFQPTIAVTIGDNIDNHDSHKPFIQIQKDQQIQRRKIKDYFIYEADDYDDLTNKDVIKTIDDEEYICYYSKILTFSTTFECLNNLWINFGGYNFSNRCYFYSKDLELDERTIESIHQFCPALESLTIQNLYMNVSAHYQNNVKSFLPTIKPCLSLKQLSLIDWFPKHNDCFDYIATKYSNLSELSLSLHLSIHPILDYTVINEMEGCKFGAGLQKIAAAPSVNPHLAKLSIDFNYSICVSEMDDIYRYKIFAWINNEFITSCLAYHPRLLLKLKYQQDLHDLIKYNIKDQLIDEIRQDHLCMNHLEELILLNEIGLMDTYIYFKKIADSGINYNNLTTLVIKYKYKECFGFYIWLDLFPNLKKMHLGGKIYIDLQQQLLQEQQKKIYKLEELEIKGGTVLLNNGFTSLGYACPLLHTLKLVESFINDSCFQQQQQHPTDVIIMDTPHLKLHRLVIMDIKTAKYNNFPIDVKRPFELIVTEAKKSNANGDDQPFIISSSSLDREKEGSKEKRKCNESERYIEKCFGEMFPSIKMILNCEHLDIVDCI
ncbi:hypothetical protein BJ944DRAFT_266706 [Cunninghamella echinulata]|nr:hypothetical protein BJ944DRAFT_266706 [Cunninghamella echinulata]